MMTSDVRRARRLRPIAAAICCIVALSGCGSSTSTSTAPSGISRCGVTLGATDVTVPAAGGTGRVTVTTARECAWTATPEAPWLSIAGTASGQGDGAVEFRAAANSDPVTRRGTVAFNDQRVDVSQAAGECTITLREPSATFGQAGGSGTIDVVASSQLCTWTATADADWVSVRSGSSGRGTAAVAFDVAPTSGPPRTATVMIAGQRFSVVQAQGCTYAIAPASQTFGSSGGSGSIALTTAAGCPWTAGSNVDWISIAPGSGNGPASVALSVTGTSGPPRTGTLVVAGQTFTVNQSAGCSYQVAPSSHTVPAGGGNAIVTVTAGDGCAWTAASEAPWLSIVSGASGSGTGVVSIAAAATTGPNRIGTLAIAGQRVTITQSAGCSYAIDPSSQNVAAGGGSGAVAVTAGTGCAWTATAPVDWVRITEGASGTGNGTVRFTVASTSGPARAATLTIAGRSFSLTQGQGCSLTVAPESATAPASGGTRTFDVQTSAGCAWTASSTVPWISIPQGGTGNGNGTVSLAVAANPGPARSGTVTVGGRTFTLNQDGGCTSSLSSTGQNVDAAASAGAVNVTAPAGCGWTAASQAGWIAVTSGASGSGNGKVEFSISANPGPARTGTLSIAGHTFTVTQSGGCAYTVAPDSLTIAPSGGSPRLQLTTTSGCTWTAASGVPWARVTEGEAGADSGSILVVVESNQGPARNGALQIADRMIPIAQGSGCTYSLSAPGQTMPQPGGIGTVTVTTTAGCPWNATSQAPWIAIASGDTGAGTGTVQFAVEPNATGAARSGTLTIAGQIFTINQEGMQP